MNVSLNLVSMVERVRIFQEATDASVNQDSLASIARPVGISVGNCHVNTVSLNNLLPFQKTPFFLVIWFIAMFLFICLSLRRMQTLWSSEWRKTSCRSSQRKHFKMWSKGAGNTQMVQVYWCCWFSDANFLCPKALLWNPCPGMAERLASYKRRTSCQRQSVLSLEWKLLQLAC